MRYATLFDLNYAPQGLALIQSMKRHCRPFKLSVLALTDDCYKLLFSLGLSDEESSTDANASSSTDANASSSTDANASSISIHRLADVMNDMTERPLSSMASSMPWKHFCWAMNAVFCEYLLGVHRDGVFSLDADTFFFCSPNAMGSDGMGAILDHCSVAAPPHRFPPHLEHTAKERGKYNVGGVWFNYDLMGRSMASWWADRVCKRCDEKTCGDQIYWDTIAEMAYNKFCELPLGFNMAPWMIQFRYGRFGDYAWVHDPMDYSDRVPLVHYHFHEFSTTHRRHTLYRSAATNRVFGLSNYHLRGDVLSLTYAPYTQAVEEAMDLIDKVAK